jgi:hypothetical protein
MTTRTQRIIRHGDTKTTKDKKPDHLICEAEALTRACSGGSPQEVWKQCRQLCRAAVTFASAQEKKNERDI